MYWRDVYETVHLISESIRDSLCQIFHLSCAFSNFCHPFIINMIPGLEMVVSAFFEASNTDISLPTDTLYLVCSALRPVVQRVEEGRRQISNKPNLHCRRFIVFVIENGDFVIHNFVFDDYTQLYRCQYSPNPQDPSSNTTEDIAQALIYNSNVGTLSVRLCGTVKFRPKFTWSFDGSPRPRWCKSSVVHI